MTTWRRFCRFSKAPETAAFSITEIPPDGLCLSAFLVITDREEPSKVLLGKINIAAPWDHLGALDQDRLLAWKNRWMLPSSHLLFLESPQDGAQRVLRELTGLSPRPLEGPTVASEVYTPQRHPAARQHWDLEFIFRGTASEDELKPMEAWEELRFLDPAKIEPIAFARAHGDILGHAGHRLAGGG